MIPTISGLRARPHRACRGVRSRSLATGALVAILAGCASDANPDLPNLRSPDVAWHELWPELADGPTVGDARFAAKAIPAAARPALQSAERAWIDADDAAFVVQRDQLADDSLASLWLARLLIYRMNQQFDRRRTDESALVTEPAWRRPQRGLIGMGEAAAPAVILDLLRERRADRSELGVEILAAMGPAVLPDLQRVLDVADVRVRRYAVRAIGGFAEPDAASHAALTAATRDPDFGVRSAAWEGHVHDAAQAAALRAALVDEWDPYVRRAVVRGLGAHRDPESAGALLAELQRGLAADDIDMVRTARAALQRASGNPELSSVADLQAWVDSLTASSGGD